MGKIIVEGKKMKRIISLLLLLIFSLIVFSINLDFAAYSEEKYKIVIKDGVKHYGEGYIKYREGIPFIYLKGNSYEIGLQYGVLLKEEINSFYALLDNLENAMMTDLYNESPWYKDILIKLSVPIVMKVKLNSFKKRAPKDYLSQLKGISKGSEVPLKKILKVTFAVDFLSCSSFVKRANDRIIHGRNADNDIQFFSKYPLIAHYNKNGKYSYIDIGIIGIPFLVTGINEHGLTLSWSQATTSTSKSIKGNGSMLMFNRIMEECRNLSDVDKTPKDVDRFVMMIGSMEDGKGAAYDILDDEIQRADMNGHFIFATNRCVSQPMRKKYNSIFDMDWFNSARAYTYKEILSNDQEFTIDEAISLLSNTNFYHYKAKVPPFNGGNINNQGTGSSVVLDPENSIVYFAYGAPFAGFSKWLRYDIKNDEVSVYKNEDERWRDPNVHEYLELKKRCDNVDWQKKDDLHQLAVDIEGSLVKNIRILHFSFWLYNTLKDTIKAKSALNELIERYPDFQLGYEDTGDFYMNHKRYGEAIQYFQEALNAPINNDTKRLYCYEQLAIAYNEIGDETKSMDYYNKVLDLYNSYWIPKQSREKVNRIEKLLRNKN